MKVMRSKVPQVGRARDLPKIRKKYTDLPNFGLMIDTTNTPHCASEKFLTRSLNPLTPNVHSIKDSFEAVDLICSITTVLFHEKYQCFFM